MFKQVTHIKLNCYDPEKLFAFFLRINEYDVD